MDAPGDRFRILTVDGGGIRGLIPALVIAELERRLQDRRGAGARVSDYFHLLAGTSTGGLVALSLTVPDPREPARPLVSAADLAAIYVDDGPRIFRRSLAQRLRTLWGLAGPKYSLDPLRDAVLRRFGEAQLGDALREVIVASYDMTGRSPYFFKRWRAREAGSGRDGPITDAALATSAAPTYFPSHAYAGMALVDGGVFAANPVVAAITEALKRTVAPPRVSTDDLLVISIGTGIREDGFEQERVSGWGTLGWVLPRRGEPPILGAVLDGASDGADHWAHMLLNHEPGSRTPAVDEIGRGPRYFRLQVELDEPVALDDAGETSLTRTLPAAARRLIEERDAELDEIADRLARFDPLPPDPR